MTDPRRLFIAACLIGTCLFGTACGCAADDQQRPEASKGILDLRGWDLAKDGSTELTGEWAFYWEELLDPEQIDGRTPTAYVQVPDPWSKYDVPGLELGPEGYATYHLTLYLPETEEALGIYIEGEGSAYTLWVDGVLLVKDGEVGASAETMTPSKLPTTAYFESDEDEVDLVLQISNFHHRKGGFRNALLLGSAVAVHDYQLQNWFLEAFAAGVLTVMGIYHLFLYLLRRKDRATLYFTLLCWIAAIRVGVTNQSTLLVHVPGIGWSWGLRIEYLVFFLAPIVFVLFLRSLYPKDIHRWFVWAVAACGVGFSLFLAFSSTLMLSYTSDYYQIIYGLEILYFIYFLVRIIRKRRGGAPYIGFGVLVLAVAIIVESLTVRGILAPVELANALPIENITSFGFLVFIVVQAILLARVSSGAFTRAETLSVELEETNVSLRHSERKYRTLFEDSNDTIFIAGLDGRIEDVSPACEEMLGYTRGELLGKEVSALAVDRTDGDRLRESIASQTLLTNFEADLRCKDGGSIHALVSVAPRQGEAGEVIGVLGSVHDITARKEAEAERTRALEMEQIAITDPLTDVYNRRFLEQFGPKELERSKRQASPFALVVLDIDHFKKVNDSFGHPIGDEVLVKLAEICRENIRSMDVLARLGGEEFIILMPDTDEGAALESAERLRERVAEDLVVESDQTEVRVTISAGVAVWDPGKPAEMDTLLSRADQAMYRSKKAGRDRVTVWTDLGK